MRGERGNRGTTDPPVSGLARLSEAVELHLKVNERTLHFPSYERYELGSQLRRSSNAIPANLAEGWNNRHIAMYLEGINRAFGELRETTHHLSVAVRKGYLRKQEFEELDLGYEECSRMLRGLVKSLKDRAVKMKCH